MMGLLTNSPDGSSSPGIRDLIDIINAGKDRLEEAQKLAAALGLPGTCIDLHEALTAAEAALTSTSVAVADRPLGVLVAAHARSFDG
jgi:hypothetical protein